MTNISLNDIYVTDNTILFNINTNDSDKIAYGNSTDSQTQISPNYTYNTQGINLNSQISNNILPMYEPQYLFHKSAIYKTSKSQRTGTTLDYQNIFSHKVSSDMSSAIQIDNVIYELEPENVYGRLTLPQDIYQMISTDNGRLFDDPNLISVQTFNKDVLATGDGANAILCSYVGLKHNMLYELPGSVKNDFDSGSVAANSIKCKNSFNSLYNNQHDVATFDHARRYIGIGKCGNQVFARYYDDINYLSSKDTNVLTQSDPTMSYGNNTLQHIEVISEINRFQDAIGHKSGLYSLVIDVPALNLNQPDSDVGAKIKENLKLEIQNCVRKIVEKLQPAQTQLNQIYVT